MYALHESNGNMGNANGEVNSEVSMIPDINLSQLPDPECASAADPPADTKSTTNTRPTGGAGC